MSRHGYNMEFLVSVQITNMMMTMTVMTVMTVMIVMMRINLTLSDKCVSL